MTGFFLTGILPVVLGISFCEDICFNSLYMHLARWLSINVSARFVGQSRAHMGGLWGLSCEVRPTRTRFTCVVAVVNKPMSFEVVWDEGVSAIRRKKCLGHDIVHRAVLSVFSIEKEIWVMDRSKGC